MELSNYKELRLTVVQILHQLKEADGFTIGEAAVEIMAKFDAYQEDSFKSKARDIVLQQNPELAEESNRNRAARLKKEERLYTQAMNEQHKYDEKVRQQTVNNKKKERAEKFIALHLGGKTLKEIGEIAGVTRERIRQLIYTDPRYKGGAKAEVYTNICPACKNEFETKIKNKLHCSKDCFKKAHFKTEEERLTIIRERARKKYHEKSKFDPIYREKMKLNTKKMQAKPEFRKKYLAYQLEYDRKRRERLGIPPRRSRIDEKKKALRDLILKTYLPNKYPNGYTRHPTDRSEPESL